MANKSATETKANAVVDAGESADKKSIHRSPAYPFISLQKAIERAQAIYAKEGRHPVRFNVAATHWGYKETSSGGKQTVAALRHFGLITVEEGIGVERVIKLTDRAIRILLDKREEERRKALQEAALAPKLYAELWEKWRNLLPSDPSFESYLTIDREFNPASVADLIRDYKSTLDYAGLLRPDSLPDGDEDKHESPELGLEDMDEAPLKDQEKPADKRGTPPPPYQPAKGEEECLRLKLAKGRMVRVLFQGPAPTQVEIEKLIAVLELSKDQYPEKDND